MMQPGRDILEQCALRGEPITACTVIDAHAHVGMQTPFPIYDSTPEGMLAAMDRMGVRTMCVSSILTLTASMERGNDDTIAAVARWPGRFWGYAIVDPARPEALEAELARCRAAGLGGIKIHSYRNLPYDHENYAAVYRFAAASQMPVLAHTEEAELEAIEPVLEAWPTVPFLLAHAGCLSPQKHARLAERYPNAYLELCVSQCPRGLLEYFVGRGLATKLLYGTDTPLIMGEHQIGRVIFADIGLKEKCLILGENARRVLRL
jgi:predicted TIM-barrel fold metal-dependent hydrolase